MLFGGIELDHHVTLFHDCTRVEEMRNPQRSSGHGRSAEGYRIFGFEFAGSVDAKIKFATLDLCHGDVISGTGERSVAHCATGDNADDQHHSYRKRDEGMAAD